MRPLKFIATASYVPAKRLTNHDLQEMVETSDQWIRDRTGIGARHVAAADESTSTLGAKALRAACDNAGMDPKDLDLIIVGTSSPDGIFPSTSCWLEHELGLGGIPAFDVAAGCSGFVYGLEIAAALLQAGTARRIGLVGAECMSKIVDWSDRRTCVLFGDAAGAAILEAGDGTSGLLASNWGADGSLAQILQVPAGGTRMPATHKTVDEHMHFVKMEGSRVFIHAVKAMSQSVRTALEQAGMSGEDVDVFIPHQANSRIMEATRERTGIPADRVFSVLERYGNVSAASVPVAIHEAREAGVLRDGHILALTAFGTGLTWAGALLRW